ncbi:MAG: glycyl-radical enzyme activating protein [Clostridia bacterium]|nr:glycyl-radical enzyme activating protein [Clostridia bacterium]
MKGFVFNIQRFSINDGPGIRTTVFVKGCNLRCRWCHNPESISPKQEIQYFPEKCVMCGKCMEVCPTGAHFINHFGEKVFDRSKCNCCGLCVQNCLYDALIQVGSYMEADEVIETVKKDIEYYRNSGGGVTFSGGEPMLQKEFVKEVFDRTKALGIHNALDTAANVPWGDLEYVLPSVDLVLLDLKAMDSAVHQQATGVPNERILENAVKLSQKEVDIIVRIPVVPGINDTEGNMNKTAEFIKDFKRLARVELLPYHDMGVDKYSSLGKSANEAVFETPSREKMEKLAACFSKHNIAVCVE